jgi:hypothetical protein
MGSIISRLASCGDLEVLARDRLPATGHRMIFQEAEQAGEKRQVAVRASCRDVAVSTSEQLPATGHRMIFNEADL